jgi:outer membrane protein assembly factor BamA
MRIAVHSDMNDPTPSPETRMSPGRPGARSAPTIAVLVAAFVLAGSPLGAQPAPGPAPVGETPAARELVIRRIEFAGLGRTPLDRAEQATGLELPAPATPEVILAATARLRESRLFGAVDVRTRPGEQPGDVVLVFEVQETRPHLRFGLGYEDFSSWYLIPVELNADNLTGRGEGLSLGARIGYRVTGLDLVLRRPGRASALDFWQLKLSGEGVERIYYLDSTETRHHVDRGGLELRVGRRLGGPYSLEGWVGTDNTQVDSTAAVYTDRASLGQQRGDEVPFEELPEEIQRDVRDRRQARLGLAVVADRRSGPGLAMHGTWTRLSGEAAFSQYGTIGSGQLDVRGYATPGPGVQLAARLRAATSSHEAPFYESYYVGGLYTVRGYASQSLSPPEGDLGMGAGSVELRHAWVGPASNPRFSAIAFVDAAAGWRRDESTAGGVAWGAGFGFRLRLPWFGQVGLDAARPLSPSPIDEAFHLHGSLGWAF